MKFATILERILLDDPVRRRALELVSALDLSEFWIAAGFVRDAVWDHLHGCHMADPTADVDVIWFADDLADQYVDRRIERELRRSMPDLKWSVKNQARMYGRNDDKPYVSVADAMRHWPETATAIAVRLDPSSGLRINAPFGLDDLFELRLRPTPRCIDGKLPVFTHRVASKRWIERYSQLVLDLPVPDAAVTSTKTG